MADARKVKTLTLWFALAIVSAALVAVSTVLTVSAFTDGRSAAATGLTGLVGALLGASGAVGAQVIAGYLQSRRDERAASNARDEAARAAVLEDNRALLKELLDVHRQLQAAKPNIGESIDPDNWRPRWKEIWTDDRSLSIDAGLRLLKDDAVRDRTTRLVRLVDEAFEFTEPAWHGRHERRLRVVGLYLTGQAVIAISEYLRRDPISADDEATLTRYEDDAAAHADWVEEEAQIAADAAAESDGETGPEE